MAVAAQLIASTIFVYASQQNNAPIAVTTIPAPGDPLRMAPTPPIVAIIYVIRIITNTIRAKINILRNALLYYYGQKNIKN